MQRCFSLRPHAGACAALLGLLLAGLPAQAQLAPGTTAVGSRSFPAQALRGKIAFDPGRGTVQLNGQPIRTAPGLRIFNTKNQLVMLTTLKGQTLAVNYTTEPSTGMLHTVWLLTKPEADRPRKGTSGRNFEFASEQQAR